MSAPPVEIVGPRLRLRPWRSGDEPALLRHADDRDVWRNLTDRFPHPYREADAVAWIASNRELGEPPPNLALELEGEAIGGIGVVRQADLERLTAEIGYWLGQAFWGQGLATEALGLMTTYAFERFDFERLEAHVLAWNPASCRVLEKAGYLREGRLRARGIKDGELVDEWLYARVRGDQRGDPCPPDAT